MDLKTGKLIGSIYSANCGWISLSNAFALVQTDSIADGADVNANGLPDAWERTFFGTLGVNPNADPDGDGLSNIQEYLVGTNPTNSLSNLKITDFNGSPGTNATLTWTTVSTRYYFIQETKNLNSESWVNNSVGVIVPSGLSTTRAFTDSNATNRFYRVQAFRPLAP